LKTTKLFYTVCDPACGSGISESSTRVFDNRTQLHLRTGVKPIGNATLLIQISFQKIWTNNTFGVDINEESVEIAKLSLGYAQRNEDEKQPHQ
jgi:hypothetical protein